MCLMGLTLDLLHTFLHATLLTVLLEVGRLRVKEYAFGSEATEICPRFVRIYPIISARGGENLLAV